ncbi:uncharacterized protein F4807DRAFT_472716 [Annulohypoxylon truncatum]|uniref:uncharacterized protein n=1 Tax=Annulohypoxylon truncatum TaxID=327061 RepID=UPI00200806E7|nr:uncharacterized protein F4807DRAFT_472716 [Annulohypoxylon truncatum]KAI1211820.1 hypothetical protein F4807DRAFT_472716 [Annulohypoxylon truncatum]
MSRTLNSTQVSAACGRGLTRSHISPIPPISPLSSTPTRHPIPPSTPIRRPHPFRGRPYDEVAAGSNSDSPLMGYIPTPVQAPVFSPIRSPFSPSGPSPSTPSTPPTKYFVSPIKDSEGARERRRELRPSPLTSLLASKGIQREVTPRPRALCPECTKVKMLLPARWCGHQVTPSRMKDGWRVVRINPNLGKTKGVKPHKPRISRHTGLEKPKPVAADSLENKVEEQTPVISEPVVELNTPERVASSLAIDEPVVEPSTPKRIAIEPDVEPTPTPKPSTVCSPSIQIPFKNPYLNDQPLHWSPRMFKPEIDRHNWTWSEWDSPSQTIEEVTYESEDWPIHDPFARYPPAIRQRLKDVLAMKPESPSTSLSAEGFSSIDFHFNGLGVGRGDSSEEKDDAESSEEDLSSWVLINDHPWSPALLQMWINGEKDRERDAARDAARRERFQLNDDTSTVSSIDTAELMDEEFGLRNHPESNHSASNRSESNHSTSDRSGCNHSDSVNMSSLFQLYIDRDNDRQRLETEDNGARNSSPESVNDPVSSRPDSPTPSAPHPDASIPSTSTPDVTIPSAPLQDVSTTPASVHDEPTLPESAPEAPTTVSELTPEATLPTESVPVPVPDASALPQTEEEFSSWVDLDTRKWTDARFRFQTSQEEGRRMGYFDSGSDDSDSDSFGFSFDITGHLQKNYGITAVSQAQEHFRSLRESQQLSVEARPAIPTSSVVSHTFTSSRRLPTATIMEPSRQFLEETSRASGFGWKSLACVAVTAATVGAGLAYAWFSN